MKAIKIHLKAVALFFSILILLQGCTVYKEANVSLEEAVRTDNKIKITTNDNQTLKFQKIGFEDGLYFGIKKIKGEMAKSKIEQENIKSVKLQDKPTSTILTIGIPVVILGVAIYFITDNYVGMWDN